MFDYIVETITPHNVRLAKYMLKDVQDTYNVLTRWYHVDPQEAHEMIKYGGVGYMSWFGNFEKWKYIDEPPKHKPIKNMSRFTR